MDIQHQDSKRGGVFFMEEDGRHLAEITYQWQEASTIVADHTWVDNSLRGQGVARKMLDVLVDFARKNSLKIIPQCSYVDVMFKRDRSLQDVAAAI
ncbi:GNAT family N-acetyltransferase [Acinetobacter sp. ACNIH1]|uniref:GNAT family N-acetyltransferase n=1 Tax=Acinetobacter sp. ACNIH1 TaxID=1636603 RepID=UPI000CDC43EA|nr:GNAT family N-acetyltransferase [Acinetobacter sp. ACNIH1]AUX90903.1 GNAT family N-acetyltransferase [Acinetobacter sp. ACNIH1]